MSAKRNFIQQPAWQAEEVGKALPDSKHACSVCLPTFDSVIGYEEGDEAVVNAMELGYPRFFLNPLVTELCMQARKALSINRSWCLPFPSREVAGRAQRFVERMTGQAGRLEALGDLIYLVVPTGEPERMARNYWRYTGEIVSSRWIEDILKDSAESDDRAVPSLKQALAALHGGQAGDHYLYPSGMGALTAAHHAVLRMGLSKPTLQLEFPYSDLFNIQSNFGTGVEFPDLSEAGAFEAELERIREGAYAAVFTEVPSNPLCRSVDLEPLSRACRESHTPLIVDDTISSFVNVDLRPYADVVTTSLTKWHVGTGDVIAGMTWVNPDSEHYEFFTEQLAERETQCPLYWRDAAELQKRLGDVRERVQQANSNGLALFEFLQAHPAVEQVWYPKNTSAEAYERVRRESGGYGGLMSLTLKDKARTPRFYDALELSKGPSLGLNFTLVCPYTLLAHYDELDWAQSRGVSRDLIRVSVGQEPTADLLSRFERALEA